MQFLPLILAGLQALDLQIVLEGPIKTGVGLMRFFKLSEQWHKNNLKIAVVYMKMSYKHFRTEALLSDTCIDQLLNSVGAGSGNRGREFGFPFIWIQLKVIYSQDLLKDLWWAKLLGIQCKSIGMKRD